MIDEVSDEEPSAAGTSVLEERAAAFRSMLAYSGKYRTEGNKIVIKVDIAADESWNGTEQVRYFRLEGDRLHIEAAPQPYANFGGKVMRAMSALGQKQTLQ